MRCAILLTLGLLLIPDPIPAGGQKDQPSKDSYVKVRVEVEVRGILQNTDKGATVTARDQLYDLFNDAEDITDPSRSTVYALDFARAKDLAELAGGLSGKEVVVTGMSELRMVGQRPRPGGTTGPSPGGSPIQPISSTWSLQRTILVTGLKSAGGR
jgi:hypothetical protein